MTAGLSLVIFLAAATARPAAKMPVETAREMGDAVIAVNKALGLESWPLHGAEPCVDRGGEGTMAKDVTAADTRRCAEQALASGFPLLGKAYAVAVTMGSIGPITVLALGMEDAAGFAAYSCDPGRKCPPTKIQPGTKWGKRMVERQQQACAAAETVWFPSAARVCPGTSGSSTATASPPTTATAPPPTTATARPTTPPPASGTPRPAR